MPYADLAEETKRLVWEGEPGGRKDWKRKWYGVAGFFEWLESRTYRMHVRVFLSRYRSYGTCADCGGSRLKAEARLFRLDGRSLPEVEALPVAEAERASASGACPGRTPPPSSSCYEVRGRLRFLVDVGLGYLTLGRQSRTLSGGEAQRVTLATALGGSLTSTLYVLDEPSVGLHPRDAAQLVGVLRRLADAGNAVVVVEHDAALIASADHVIDLGPGPGREGGEVVYEGPGRGPARGAPLEDRRRTSRAGSRCLAPPGAGSPTPRGASLVRGARENNLKDVTVDVPARPPRVRDRRLGLGQVLARGPGRSTATCAGTSASASPSPGPATASTARRCSPGSRSWTRPRSARPRASTPRPTWASWSRCARSFAKTPEARERGLKPTSFSFNSASGACPVCEGAGYEKVEMQFLPDAFVKCGACDGRRFRPEVLEVRCRGLSIADALDLPAADVVRLFGDAPGVRQALQPMLDLGLGYLSLSQPAPTLSGGEAQRLKLARALAEAGTAPGRLYLLDEPTTGLHAADVAVLVGAMHRLVEAGHSVVVVEHNTEVALASDWVLDLGPEAGDEGGRVVGEGPPEAVARLDTPTGRALAGAFRGARRGTVRGASGARAAPAPRPRLARARRGQSSASSARASTTCSGSRSTSRATSWWPSPASPAPASRPSPSTCCSPRASGASSTASRPTCASSSGRSPGPRWTASRACRPPSPWSRSSRAARRSRPWAPRARSTTTCASSGPGSGPSTARSAGWPGQVVDAAALAARVAEDFPAGDLTLLAPLVRRRKGFHLGRDRRRGEEGRLGGADRRDAPRRGKPPRIDRFQIHDVEAVVARVWRDGRRRAQRRSGARGTSCARPTAPAAGGGDRAGPGARQRHGDGLAGGTERFYSTRRSCPSCGTGLPAPDPRLFSWSQKYGACPECDGFGAPRVEEDGETRRAEGVACRACGGTRLRPEARAVRIGGRHIGEVAALTVVEARAWLGTLEGQLPEEVRERVWPELTLRLDLLARLGLGYLTLERGADTLSTGEAQRIRIVAALASNLRGVCYVLDEPTVGLHPRDDEALTKALLGLRDRGNTVVVVEHEESVIRAADHVVDLGPGAGPHGGRLVAQGSPRQVARVKESVTGLWLRGEGERAALAAAEPAGRPSAHRRRRPPPQPARPDRGRCPSAGSPS